MESNRQDQCERVLTCVFSSCCNSNTFQKEMLYIYSTIFSLSTLIAIFWAIKIHYKVNKGEKRTVYNFFLILQNMAISIYTLTLMMLKILEMSLFETILQYGEAPEGVPYLSTIIIQHS